MPSACVLTKYGPPSVLEWTEVAPPEPSIGEIRVKAIVSGVGPTDLKIRRGSLAAVYPLPDRAVLGFETAGVVDAVGDAFSSWTPGGAPDAIAIGLELLANGELQLRSRRSLPMSDAAEAHRLLEEEGVREKLLLTTE